MPQISVTINGRSYPVACDEGQEARIRELARLIDGKVAAFARQVGEARLLVLAALVLADELADAKEARRGADGDGAANGHALAGSVDRLAQRIEAVAAQLESSHI
jgi:cell division protein ZapA